MGTNAYHSYIVNETAANLMGFSSPEKALVEPLFWHPWDGNNPESLKSGAIIGVVKDFNYKSLYDKVEPTVIQIYPQAAWKVAIKVKTAGIDNTIEQVRKVWNNFSPEFPLEYKFLDDNFEQMYKSEDKLKSLLWLFTGIAIFVGCMGLFGLAAYTAERRKKEVGIRKVLGASVEGVVVLLSKDFIKLVFLSILIASPLAWVFMNRWLQDFAYRIQISGWVFLIAGLLAILIAFFTVSFQAIKVALTNPVNSLKSE
jgi:putative ABC transport system permease protein